MKGFIKIYTPIVTHQLPVNNDTLEQVYEKCRKLKEWVRLQPETPFEVVLELSSKMNDPGFEVEDDIDFLLGKK